MNKIKADDIKRASNALDMAEIPKGPRTAYNIDTGKIHKIDQFGNVTIHSPEEYNE